MGVGGVLYERDEETKRTLNSERGGGRGGVSALKRPSKEFQTSEESLGLQNPRLHSRE